MHHHHPHSITTMNTASGSAISHQRRRKKRPNYGTRTVEVRRGYNGFGFTISGQQPCRLSCIVTHSPADQAGLRAGDFLISVNGLNVSKLPHETVVQLIGNSFGSIRMQIAENYFSDSSDEENAALTLQQQSTNVLHHTSVQLGILGTRVKPRYLYHKTKTNRLRTSTHKKHIPHQIQLHRPDLRTLTFFSSPKQEAIETRPQIKDLSLTLRSKKNEFQKLNFSSIKSSKHLSSDVANVSAMVRVPSAALEYRAIVGYLGTIEMPKQISHSSKLQTVRSCIRKLRQEKRQPTTVLVTILPDCLRLQSANGNLLATYASERLNYVSTSSESENRFFGLVTSAVHTLQVDDEDDDIKERTHLAPSSSCTAHISISNSCHVFVIDTKLCDHQFHKIRANEFRIQCTKDPISNLCLEFPNNSEYVVNLIRSMYTMRILPPASRKQQEDYLTNSSYAEVSAHSPQPSNLSEISTTTSNSDSGIGFYNDLNSISDRILVVDFPKTHDVGINTRHVQPNGILKGFGTHLDNRLTVRAMPDPKASIVQNDSNLTANYSLVKGAVCNIPTTRSCDDVLSLVKKESEEEIILSHISLNNISLHLEHTAGTNNTFLYSSFKQRDLHNNMSTISLSKDYISDSGCSQYLTKTKISASDKLSPQVFGLNLTTKHCLDFQAIDSNDSNSNLQRELNAYSNNYILNKWSSLHDLQAPTQNGIQPCTVPHLGSTNSEPDLGNFASPPYVSPLRRTLGQPSFRSPGSNKNTQSETQNHIFLKDGTTFMTTSENNVHIASMDGYQSRCQEQISENMNDNLHLKTVDIFPQTSTDTMAVPNPTGAVAWGSCFERMLKDPAGIHSFAEFLKKEFSAENIYFWTACERFRHMEHKADRAVEAMCIFTKHLANGAMEPVNVDSQARNLSEEVLKSAEPDIFLPAQKQIFNLMKFDSYQRFIRSDLYKNCLEAQEKNLPLPYGVEDLDELLITNFHQSISKLKKSASNAEDRRRKSLLPWHRKMRSKSRDRDTESSKSFICKLPQLSGNSLKIGSTQTSINDTHSSRSSLSSFDALPVAVSKNQNNGQGGESSNYSLCRVILNDGATTIVQIRPYETVKQLVERLLEKRGLIYQFYDVVTNGSTKSIDLQSSAQIMAGKEMFIEQRVAFKLDLPDPKVISVKSKPKKQLHEVVRPILEKYNYIIDAVQVVLRDTQEQLDLSLPVTVVDGQRLQIIQLKQPHVIEFAKPMFPKNISFPKTMKQLTNNIRDENSGQSTLDEITNKVFSELLQVKVDTQGCEKELSKTNDICSLKSDDCASESSSVFDSIRETGIQMVKLNMKNKSSSSQNSEEKIKSSTSTTTEISTVKKPQTYKEIKKPIIAKLKAGVKVQVTERVVENQDELLEGLKRAQLARLEDQRGTEINFELPEFLKNKENINEAASKLRKVRANLSPVTKIPTIEEPTSLLTEGPQPAPRFSITNKQNSSAIYKKNYEISECNQRTQIESITLETEHVENHKEPPPLPPKPKILPIKPSNWGVSTSTGTNYIKNSVLSTASSTAGLSLSNKTPIVDINRKTHSSNEQSSFCYLEETSSSFV